MKLKEIIMIFVAVAFVFLAGGSVISQEIRVVQLPEASIVKPLFQGKDIKSLVKKLATKKNRDNPALKINLILSEPVPLFSASP